jgi:hypothetical protein
MVTITHDGSLSFIGPSFSMFFQILGHFVLDRRLS